MTASNPALSSLGNVVPEGYRYYEKLTTPADDLVLPGGWLKWYDLYPTDAPVTQAQRREARDFLAAEAEAGRLHLERDLGFAILHRAGTVLLLIVTTWRHTNEMWETVWVRQAEGDGSYRQVTHDTTDRATYCVWELAAVWHERDAWVRFLASNRDEAAKREWLGSRFTGSA